MKILLTGGNGFIGRNLVDYIKNNKKWNIVTPSSSDINLERYEDCEDIICKYKPDVIWHGAAICGGIGANMGAPYEYCYKNAIMGQNIINACINNYIPDLFINMGTVCSYPERPPTTPFIESEIFDGYPEKTNAPYGIAKRYVMTLGEAAISKGLSFYTLMMTNNYGKYDHFEGEKSHVIPALIKKINKAKKDGTDLHVFGTGNATRDFIFAEDSAAAIVRAIDVLSEGSPLNNHYRINIGTGIETRISDLVNMISELLDFHGCVVWDKDKPDGQPRRILDISLMKKYADWQPSTSLFNGLIQTIEWYKSV